MSACAEPTILRERDTVYLTVPESVYSCPEEPTEPVNIVMQSDAGYYITALKDFGRKCKAASLATREWNEKTLKENESKKAQ